jgi:hypothetical protein
MQDIRREVSELSRLGPFPDCNQTDAATVKDFHDLLKSINKPVTDSEARVLISIFGPDDYYGLAWTLIHLIETAPGWPLEDVLQNDENEWIQLLKTRIENGKLRRREES